MKAKGCFPITCETILVLTLGLLLLLSQSCSKRPVEPEPELQLQGDPEPEPEPEPVPPDRKAGSMPIVVKYSQPSNTLSDDDLVEIATRYRAVTDAKTLFTAAQMARLRQVNPEIIIIRYLNFSSVDKSSSVLHEHPEWILRDENGDPMPSLWQGTGIMMDPGSEGWRGYLAGKATQFVTQQGYDGLMGDVVLMVNELDPEFSGINTRTGQPYTTQEYRDDQYQIVLSVKEALGLDKFLVLNSVQRGSGYFEEEPYRFLEASDGVVAEGFRGLSRWPLDRYLTEEAWIDNVEMMLDVQSRQKAIVAVIKFHKDVVNSQERLRDYELFMFTTFLMGMGDSCYYTAKIHDPEDPYSDISLYFDHWEIDLGEPLDPYESNGSHYQREFENARVLVNPTESPATVYLGGDFRTLEGETVSEVPLDAHTGTILLK